MSLISGASLGPYEIISPLGAGGMGEVYRARDTRLDRDVAIKVLPEALARDKERIQRFEREAKVLASLNHPNIAAIYGFEEADGKRFLVMELAEGETLADRLARGPIPLHDALDFAVGMALALEAAHEKGIIHRDLKPANVKVTPDGTIKVLDFGLAKAMTGDASATNIANSPTITAAHTGPGVVLGTAAYMSPEQARGRPVDKRTDIWSFGCVLFECLSGQRPFQGASATDLIAKILERDPDWSALPAATPPFAQLVLRRCLVKDRNKRLRDIGDARVDIEASVVDPTSGQSWLRAPSTTVDSIPARQRAWPYTALALATIVGAGLGWWSREFFRPNEPKIVTRFSVDVPSTYQPMIGEDDGRLGLDPTGSTLAFTATTQGKRSILVRRLSDSNAIPVPGTDGGSGPFFSPDGRWLGFFAGGKMMKVPLAGGPPLTICESSNAQATWLEDGSIAFTVAGGHELRRVSDKGGSPTVLAHAGPTHRAADGEQLLLGFQTAHAVAGASYVLAAVWDGATIQDYDVVAVSLADGSVRSVVHNAVDPQYVAPGYLVFLREDCLMAAPFDAARGVATGEAVQVLDGVRASTWGDKAHFATSRNGALAYIPGGRRGPGRKLIRVDVSGKSEPLTDVSDAIVGGMRVSPDGHELLVTTLRRNIELWTFNMDRRSFTLVHNVGETWGPVWTPDGKEVVFQLTIPDKESQIVRKRADGIGPAVPVPIEKIAKAVPVSFSPDGARLLLNVDMRDIVQYRWGQPGPTELVLEGVGDITPRFAPDGQHLAYVSDETGRDEVFVRTLGDAERKRQVSYAGGDDPVWSRDGTKLYFLDQQNVLHAVTVDLTNGPQFSVPEKLFDTAGIATTELWGTYDVLPDGHFVMVQPADWEKQPPRIHVVLNWHEELAKRWDR